MTVIDHIKNYTEFLVYYLFKIILRKSKHQKKTLLLVNTGLIGDLLVSSILLENPKVFKNFNKVKFLIREEYLDLFKKYNGKIEFVGYNYNKYKFSLIYKYKFLSKLRAEGFEKSIHLTAARGILNEEMVHLIGAKESYTINSFLKYLGNGLGKYFYKKYKQIIATNILNEYEKHYEVMKFLSGNNIKTNFNNSFTFNEDAINGREKFNKYKDSIVIAPFSSRMNREWKKEYYFEVINKLKEKHKIVLLGSAKQKNVLKELVGKNNNTTILAGELKLFEIPLLLKQAKLFIGQDSGLTHMALKMGTPLIAIIGGGEFGRFFPYMESEKVKFLYSKMDCFLCHWECSKTEMFCITDVTPQIVEAEIKQIVSS